MDLIYYYNNKRKFPYFIQEQNTNIKTKELLWKASYTAFGIPQVATTDKLEGVFEFHGMFSGCQFDEETSLSYHWNRWRNEAGNSFISEDLIRDGANWYGYAGQNPINFQAPDGLFYYNAEGQQSITTVKKTTVIILRNSDGLGNQFDSGRLIYKNDGFTTKLAYVDNVGANCRDIYDGTKGSTTPDGKYYLSNKILTEQADGSYDSSHFENVLSLMTTDTSIPEKQRAEINKGDRLFHTNQYKDETDPYNSTNTPGGAGCIIDQGQEHHNEMMNVLMDGTSNPENITVYIRSMNNIANKEINISF